MSGLDSNERIFEDIWALWHKGLLDYIEKETDPMIYGPGTSAWFRTYKQSFNLGTTWEQMGDLRKGELLAICEGFGALVITY